MDDVSTTHPAALQRCPEFVGRTTNWLYDHLRCVPRYTPFILCNTLVNRDEFPELQAWSPRWSLARRMWQRLTGDRYFPSELRKLKRLRPRLLHSHFGNLAAQDLKLVQALDIPWLVSFYGADAYQGEPDALRRQYGLLFEKATRVLALGPAMGLRLVQLGCPHEKVLIHPLGVDVEMLPSTPRLFEKGKPIKILFAGTFREKKGIQYVIEAMALVIRAGIQCELHLVASDTKKGGDAETKQDVFQRISDHGLESVVFHRPFLEFHELIKLALSTHVFVAPSVTAASGDSEGTPFVLQQMMATGMPVIATRHSDIPFLFGKHEDLLVPERDAGAIANRLRRYVEEPDRLVQDGAALRSQISTFDIHTRATRLSDFYDAVC